MDSPGYLSLITSQHRTKPNFLATVKASVDPIIDAINCLNTMNEKFDIDTATGDQLQIIADWIGAANAIPNSVPVPFFGFDGQPDALPFSETDDASVGGYFRESGISDSSALTMNSDLFKKVVQAKILLNNTDCSDESAKQIISLVTDKKFKFTDNLNMTVTFSFLDSYEIWEKELVRLMFPVPSGVRLLFEGEDDY